MNYLVIDLEMCKVPKHYRNKTYKYAQEIIQIGCVLLDEQFEIIGKLNQYVRPQYGVIDHFIADLTGIENRHVKYAPYLEEALQHMLAWIGEREYKIYAWSDSDHHQLMHEIVSKGMEDSTILDFMNLERWLDYQAVYGKRFGYVRSVSLGEALLTCDIDVDGKLHDGLEDAIHTAKLVKFLEEHPDYEFCNYEKGRQAEVEPLNFSLGDLFAGLSLEFAS